MDTCHGLRPLMELVAKCAVRRRSFRGVLRGMVIAGMLAVACGAAYGEGAAEMETERLDGQVVETLPIIVNLAVEQGTASDALTDVRTRVLDRLREAMPVEAFAAVRTYANFPIISLTADRDLVMLLLTLPEVISIERDPELTAAPTTF